VTTEEELEAKELKNLISHTIAPCRKMPENIPAQPR